MARHYSGEVEPRKGFAGSSPVPSAGRIVKVSFAN